MIAENITPELESKIREIVRDEINKKSLINSEKAAKCLADSIKESFESMLNQYSY